MANPFECRALGPFKKVQEMTKATRSSLGGFAYLAAFRSNTRSHISVCLTSVLVN